MNERYHYDEKSDSLFIYLKDDEEERFEEIVPGINIELNENDEIIGVEILKASRFCASLQKPVAVKHQF